ncbi:HD domain-containing protein [Rhizobium sp. SYY.PMSO]|uniref:HD domain-containing protein n=1 Tax=Rhizobium sp. SYY.PMSO TaxID=3382192 RepID=UPI00399027D9
MVDGFLAQLAFLIEIDRLKLVERQSRLAGGGRRENSAEHSWHLALVALTLGKGRSLDLLNTVKMLLIHDLVEIDAGDTPLHGTDRPDKLKTETLAARRIFGLLPPDQGAEYFALWEEFETGLSGEAAFARAIDRLQPLLLNLVNEGGTWAENGVSLEMVFERYGSVISPALPDLWPDVMRMVRQHFDGRSSPLS